MGFENIYNHKAVVKESANARVNLIGEHTDYTGGYVMPTLLSFKNTIELSRNAEKTFVVFSEHFNEKKIFNDFIKSKSNDWSDYIKGCLFIFFDEYKKIKLEHFNIQSTMGRRQVLSGRDFDRIVDEAEEVWLQEVMIKEGGASA